MAIRPTEVVDTEHTPTQVLHERLRSSRRALHDQVRDRKAPPQVTEWRQEEHGSAHVYRLRDLLLRSTPRAQLEQHERFRGVDSLEMRVLRACVGSRDLDELLIQLLGSEGIARELGREGPTGSTVERARRLASVSFAALAGSGWSR